MGSKAYEYSINMKTPFSNQKWDISAREESKIRRSLTLQAKVSLITAFLLVAMIIALLVYFLSPSAKSEDNFWPSYVSESKLGRYQSAAISSDAAPCAAVARDILERNGSAVDAAIAALVCMGINNPQSMGFGGGFLMLYYNRTEKKTYYLDAREVAPRKATENMFEGNKTIASDGGLSIAVPGELAGYVEAHRQFGRLPWKELFNSSIQMCQEGITVNRHLVRAIRKIKEKMFRFEALRNIYLKNSTNKYEEYEVGEKIKRPDLAHTLETIAQHKMEALYGNSEMARQFLKDLNGAGSIIDKTDMQNYAPEMRLPVTVHLRNNSTLHTVSIPGSGHLLAFMLRILDGYPDMKNASKSERLAALAYHRMTEAFKYAYAIRNQLEDEDNAEIKALLEKLLSWDYAEKIRQKINDSYTSNSVSDYGAKFHFTEDHGTAHLSLVAPNGDAVSVTSTINQYFGSKVLSPSTGIILNNEMDDFTSPNITNYFGLPPSPWNRIRPGKRPFSSMCPMILTDSNGDVRLVLGGNGGTGITSGVLQVAARVLLFRENIKEGIDAPRIHHQLTPNILHYENNFPKSLVEELRKFGHDVQEWDLGMMSIIMGITRDDNGTLYANSDYRKGGSVDGF